MNPIKLIMSIDFKQEGSPEFDLSTTCEVFVPVESVEMFIDEIGGDWGTHSISFEIGD